MQREYSVKYSQMMVFYWFSVVIVIINYNFILFGQQKN